MMVKEIQELIKQMKKGLTQVKRWAILDHLYIDKEVLIASDSYYMFAVFHSLNIEKPMAILNLGEEEEKVEYFNTEKVEYSNLLGYCLKDIYKGDIKIMKKTYSKYKNIKNYQKLSDRGFRLEFEEAIKRIQSEFPCYFPCDVLQRAQEVTEGFGFDEFQYTDNATPIVIRHRPFGCDVHQWEALLILQPQQYIDLK